MAAFSVGYVVRLKSGGPKMTVTALPDPDVSYSYACQWFANDSERKIHRFPAEALELVKDE